MMATANLPVENSPLNTTKEKFALPPETKDDQQERQSTSTNVAPKEEEYIVPYDPDEYGFRRIIRNFSPSWFVVTMGTGAVSTLLYDLPYQSQWLHVLAAIFHALNTVLWFSFIAVSCLRYAMYPELWGALLRNPKQRLFLGTIPTGFATIINMTVALCVEPWGQGITLLAWILWWINSIVAVYLCLYLSLTIINIHKADLSGMTPLWLLPILPAAISATTGGIIAPILDDPQHQLWTLLISYILWGLSIPTAMFILVLYFYRLQVHEMLDKEVIVSVFLPIGPFGLGGFSLFLFGKIAMEILPKTGTLSVVPNAGAILYVFGFISSLVMWGFAFVWIFLALSTIYQCKTFPFNMGWWSFTFPLAVFALSTIQFGKELESSFFKVLGTVISCIVFLLWIVVAILTVKDSITGKMFFAPCLNTDMKLKELKIKRAAVRASGMNAS